MKISVSILVFLLIESSFCYKNLVVRSEFKDLSGIVPVESVVPVFVIAEGFGDVRNISDIEIDATVFGNTYGNRYVVFENLNVEYIEEVFQKLEIEYFVVLNTNFQVITENSFKYAAKLRGLFLAHNGITQINKSAFLSTQKIRSIDLQFNKISKIERGTFDCPDLVELRLNNNELKALEDNTFEGASYLKILVLDYNQIEAVSKEAFNGLESLQELSVSHSKITILEKGTFSENRKLEDLDLSQNLIEVIHEGIFAFNLLLNDINLSSNKIVAISPEAFNRLQNLNSLDLRNNFCFKKDEILEDLSLMEESLKECFEYYGLLDNLRDERVEKMGNGSNEIVNKEL